jgi:hypothetical protein
MATALALLVIGVTVHASKSVNSVNRVSGYSESKVFVIQ